MHRQISNSRDHADTILARLAHADDAAAAHVDAGISHMPERVEPLLVSARRDDLAVELRRGVEVVIVVVEAGRFEPRRLLARKHAKRGAGLEPKCVDALDHGADLVEIALLRLAPGRPHAEAA